MKTLAICLFAVSVSYGFADPPEIVSTSPKISATDVDPSTTTVLTVTFDQPMAETFSWTGGGDQFPTIPAKNQPYWTLDRKTCSLPVLLEPGKQYRLGINSPSHRNFKSAQGEPVAPTVLRFSTASDAANAPSPNGDTFFVDDLESGDDAPAGWKASKVDGVKLTWDSRVAHSGNRSLRLIKTANRYFPIASWSKRVEHTSADAEAVRLAAFVKSSKAKKAVLDVLFLDASGKPLGHNWAKYIGEDDANPDGITADWTKHKGTVAIPAGTQAFEFSIQMYGPGTVWFDDIKASYAPASEVDTE